jgi:hypothetical protein
MKLTRLLTGVVLGLIAFAPARAIAGPIEVSYGLGNFSAVATFDQVGSNLVVTLTNTGKVDPTTSGEILTGIFFNVAGDPALTGLSADICSPGCAVTEGGALGIPPNLVSVAGEWAFRHKTGLGYGANFGLSAVAAGSRFTDTYLIGGPNSNQSGEAGPGGIDYGVTTANDTEIGDKSSLWAQPLISNQVILTLAGLPGNFDINAAGAISNIQFQFGTGSREAPEPATILLLGMGAAGAAALRRRRKSA